MGAKDKDSDCKMTDVKTSGAKTTWKIACTKPEPMTGTGEMTHTGDKFAGTMKLSGKMQGENFSMNQVMSGRKIGNCTYEDPGKKVKEMQAQNQAMIAKECDKQIDDLNPLMVFGGANLPPEAVLCKDRKADFCARSAKLAQQMREPAAFAEGNRKYPEWREAMKACGSDPMAVSGPVCKAAADKKDWKFVADYCPAEGRALAQKHCAGLDYTSAMASEYKDICQRFGADVAKEKVGSPDQQPSTSQATETAGKPAAESTPEQKQNKTMDTVKEGASKLKKFLKF
jgi:hypothetical protein